MSRTPGWPWKKSSATFSTQENLRFSRRLRRRDRILAIGQAVFPRPAGNPGLACTVLALLATLAAAAAAAEQPVLLEYRFRPGERIDMRVAHRALTETTVGATSQATETATDSRKTWRVVAVDAEGRATLEHSVDDVTMSSRTSDRGEVRWTSAGTEPAPPGYEAVRASLGVPLARMVIDRSGRVLERRELRPCPASATGDLAVVPLPERSVAVGAEWTVPQEVVAEAPGGLRKAVRTRLRYRLIGIRDGIATIRVDTTVLTPVDDPRLESRLLERIWDGTIEFDVDRGRLLRRATEIDRRVVGFEGPESSVRYKASLEERLEEHSGKQPDERVEAAPAAN